MSQKRLISKADRLLWGLFGIGILIVVGAILDCTMALSAMFTVPGEAVNLWEPITITAIVGFVYIIPTIVGRKKRKLAAIAVLNVYLGWTVIGWIVALVWASLSDRD
jgi:hypothetical protein